MITCKEDLHNTWIKNDKGELRDLYISLAKSFGIIDETCHGGLPFIGIFSEWEGCEVVGNTSELLFDQESRKQLTIKDLKKEKPTPTKFVKVEESIFDLKGEFERGELYCKNLCASDDYTKLNTEVALFGCAAAGNVYRKVEVDWVESVIGLVPVGYGIDRSFSHRLGIAGSYNKEQALTLANAIIASLTEKPE